MVSGHETPATLQSGQSSRLEDVELAAAYLVERAERQAGRRSRQGEWHPAFRLEAEETMPEGAAARFPALSLLSRVRIVRVPERALRGLFTWARGASVAVRLDVPAPEEVLELQARGARCVSLLPDGVSTAPHADGREFLVHDLCHLEKFTQPEHYLDQVGFFATLSELARDAVYSELEQRLDSTFVEERRRLGSDVNGSSVYLFALLKMKLKMAARRRHARLRGLPPPSGGPLDPNEHASFDELEEALYDALGFTGELREAARATSARRDDQRAGLIAAEFSERGRLALNAARAAVPPARANTR